MLDSISELECATTARHDDAQHDATAYDGTIRTNGHNDGTNGSHAVHATGRHANDATHDGRRWRSATAIISKRCS